ncbi:MAG: [protein-PII] uridylyltransferase [Syntrophaceae bacterium]|nr:[protein-PII] uridylyltransferase [Syntrophaceae bacterium]
MPFEWGEFLRQNTERMDGIVRKTFQRAQSQIPSPSVCLMAIGGYGRSELAPYSDVDLLLLYDSSQKEKLPPLVEKILYPLWDLGLDVNCSSRSIHECLKMAQSDLHAKTSLIDGRYLDGEYEFFRKLYDHFTKKVLHRNVKQFAEHLARELILRRKKYGDPNYILEPNVKEGVGGLRDFQMGRWIIRARYKTDRWDSILFPDHSRMLENGLQFLWTVRNQLHLLSGRRQDDLTFEMQETIAPLLGYHEGILGVEEMMRQYHLSTQRIANFVQDILDRALHDSQTLKRIIFFIKQKKIDDHFALTQGEIRLLDPAIFKKDINQLMTLFSHCQTYQARMDFRTEEAVIEALPLVDNSFRNSEKVSQMFLSMFKKRKGIGTILKKMHELGFLSRYIPEFSILEGKVHYDLYHIHPVDIHSLYAVEELEKLSDGLYQKDHPLLTSLVRGIEKPEILFLTTLLHDIGKGRGGDHSLTGAHQVKSIGERMGLSPEDRECAAFLVTNHLLMVKTALRRDLRDEQVIFRFAQEVKNLQQLKMLYLLTFADTKAVGPEALTNWKETLLMELFLKTSHLFERNGIDGPFLKGEAVIEQLRKRLPPETFMEYVEHLPERYLSCYSTEEILHHIEMAHSMEKEPFLVEWKIEKELLAKVTLCTKDRYGLFSKIAGSMFLNRLSILEAQVHTWENGIALDTFWVEDRTGGIEPRLHQFKQDLEEILDGKVFLKDLLFKRNETYGMKQKVIPRVRGEVKIDNHDSDFFTIVEVTGEDRLGILYEITQTLTEHGCNIYFARISTLGNRIVDVFYIQDTWGEKLEENGRIDRLKQILLARLAST